MKLDKSYILPTIMALVLHGAVFYIMSLEWGFGVKAPEVVTPIKQVKATLVDFNNLPSVKREKARQAKEKLEQEKREKAKLEQERLAQQKREQEKREQERLAQQKREQEKREQERLAQQKREQEKREQEKRAQEKLAKEKREQEKVAKQIQEQRKKEELAQQQRDQEKREEEKRAQIEQELQAELASSLADEEAQLEQELASALANEEADLEASSLEQQLASAQNYIYTEVAANWVRPPDALNGMVVELRLSLVPTGKVQAIELIKRDATDALVASVEAAIKKVGTFTQLRHLDSQIFDQYFRIFIIRFKPEDLRR